MIKIRQATLNDMEVLKQFTLIFVAESLRYRSLGVNVDKVLHTMRGFIECDDYGVVLLADLDGELVGGFMGAIADEWQSDNTTSFDMINFVDPKHRGSGVARELCLKFIEWSKSKGVKAVQCGTATGVNTEHAIKLYSSMGFNHIGSFLELEL